MKAGRFLPIGVLGLLLVLSLATLGVGYALWSDVLNISGIVHTGEVEAHLSLGDVIEHEAEGKDVAICTAQLQEGPLETDGDRGPDRVLVRIENGYPSFVCEVPIDVTNAGTIPIKVERPKLLNKFAQGVGGWESGEPVTAEMEGCWPEDEPLQLHPGESSDMEKYYPDCHIRIHIEQNAEENQNEWPNSYEFQGEFMAWQWNEDLP